MSKTIVVPQEDCDYTLVVAHIGVYSDIRHKEIKFGWFSRLACGFEDVSYWYVELLVSGRNEKLSFGQKSDAIKFMGNLNKAMNGGQ
jgi:hypothetical protein